MDRVEDCQFHVLNNFQVYIPLAGDADGFVFTQTTAPSFGLTLTRVDTNDSFHYQIQMLLANGVSEQLISDGLVWAKRIPHQFQQKENSNIVEALLCRLRIPTGVFNFKRMRIVSVRFVVNCFFNNSLLSTGVSNPCRILPKKRIADDERDESSNRKIFSHLIN
ncbi:hypothetical protein HW132_35135 [Brasilonema sp. CT11]|nr:hypothetical protein [Brasilonema sp. CT11]